MTAPHFLRCLALGMLGAAAQTPLEPCTSDQHTGLVPANGISIAYASDGSCDATRVLLIGGTGQQLIEWPTELVQELTGDGYRVVRFDNRDGTWRMTPLACS